MSDSSLIAFQQRYPHLFRDTDISRPLSPRSIVDRVLRRSDEKACKDLFHLFTKDQIKQHVIDIVSDPHSDFPPQYIPFYLHYFSIDASIGECALLNAKRNSLFYRPVQR